MDLNRLTLGEKIAGITGILLLIDLLFLPWHSLKVLGHTFTRHATESPNGFWGILALLLTLAVIAAIVLRKLTNTNLPELPIGWGQAIFFGTIAVLVVLLIKLVSETSSLGFGAWLGILLAAGMVYGGFLMSKEPETATGGSTPLA